MISDEKINELILINKNLILMLRNSTISDGHPFCHDRFEEVDRLEMEKLFDRLDAIHES